MSRCDWLIALSIMSSRFLHNVARVGLSFLFKAESHSVVWTGHMVFIHSPITEHMGCFWLLAVVNKHLSETLLPILLEIYPDVELLGHMIVLFFVFEDPSHCSILHSHQ